MLEKKDKFKFTEEYQWDLLRYITQDRNGEKAIKKIEDHYFTLIEHQVIAYVIKKIYKKNNRIPGETIFRENLIRLLNSKKYVALVTKDEQKEIVNLVKPLYREPIKDGDEIYKGCKEFSAYIRLKNTVEEIDITDFSKYPIFSQKVQTAIYDEDEKEETESSFLLADIKSRQLKRQSKPTVFPTPFRQINQLTNAGGYEPGSIMVMLDKQKRGKTAMLVNIGRGYLKMGEPILVIDLENGKDNYLSRLEQSIMDLEKSDLISGEHDNKVQRRFRKYKRLGGEIVVERMPALVTNANDIQRLIDKYYREYGIQFKYLIVDYAAKMASINKTSDDQKRISDTYIELANLAIKNDIIHIWTANHVTREAAKHRMKTRYTGEDIALCIEITRNASAIFGLNRSPEEEEAGLFRMEVVEQRDGVPNGRAVFHMNMKTQRAEELGVTERKEYDDEFYAFLEDEEDGTKEVSKKKDRKDDFGD